MVDDHRVERIARKQRWVVWLIGFGLPALWLGLFREVIFTVFLVALVIASAYLDAGPRSWIGVGAAVVFLLPGWLFWPASVLPVVLGALSMVVALGLTIEQARMRLASLEKTIDDERTRNQRCLES
ncbi:hypothetical protein D3C86_1830820 [compost metagenome]